MTPLELANLVRIRRPPAPHGSRRLARAVSVADVARIGRARLPQVVRGYLDGGGEDEHTMLRNRKALSSIQLTPQLLRDVSNVSTSTTVLGSQIGAPLALAPVGAPGLFHPHAELGAARAAGRAGLPLAVSTLSSVTLEDVADVASGPLWFSLYVWGDRSVARQLVERAGRAGYSALIVTADVAVRSKRERELRAGLSLPTPSLTATSVFDAVCHPAWSWGFATGPRPTFPNLDAGATHGDISDLFDGTLTWDDLDWIRAQWDRPLVLKGVLTAADATRAADAGVDAVIVSNHGGRQLDQVSATIDALPGVVAAVGDRVEVLIDSGFRRGTHVLAALALGAKAVLLGRPWLYGLAAAGESGIAHVLDIVSGELRTAMALVGVADLADLPSAGVVVRS